MKILTALLFLSFLPSMVIADTYTGTVSGVKHFARGGIAVNLDGAYPNQKMTLYVPENATAKVGALPSPGVTVTATGTITQYKGKPEIKIYLASQWKWY